VGHLYFVEQRRHKHKNKMYLKNIFWSFNYFENICDFFASANNNNVSQQQQRNQDASRRRNRQRRGFS
jgi:hypothetical protein